MTQSVQQPIEIRLRLEDKDAENFIQIKNRYGLKTNSETVRLLIKKELEGMT